MDNKASIFPLERASESDRQWLVDIFMDSYVIAYEVVTVKLSIPIAMGAESIADESGCRSTITISYSATMAGGSSITVTNVVLKVNGEIWAD